MVQEEQLLLRQKMHVAQSAYHLAVARHWDAVRRGKSAGRIRQSARACRMAGAGLYTALTALRDYLERQEPDTGIEEEIHRVTLIQDLLERELALLPEEDASH